MLDLTTTPGLGYEDFPGFSADECPEVLPDISRHHSSLADVLKQDANVYLRLRARKTSLGVGLARCIKVGMDNRGHAMVKTIGIVAGDEECYDVFRELFEPVIRRHLETGPRMNSFCHPTILPSRALQLPKADPSGRCVMSSQIRVYRSLSGYRMPPSMGLEERAQVEGLLVSVLCDLDGSLRGEYFPLGGSMTHLPRIGGMSAEDENGLRSKSFLFEAPDSTLRLCTGAGKHWPHARGVFVNGDRTFCAWVNEQEHLRLVSSHKGDCLARVFSELVGALDEIAMGLQQTGDERLRPQVFSRSNRWGFLTSNPAVLGTTMHISVMVMLPKLASLETDVTVVPAWRAWCVRQRAQVRRGCDDKGAPTPGLFEVCNCDRYGFSEVELVVIVNEVVRRMVEMEQRLEVGKSIDDLLVSDVDMSLANSGQHHANEVADKARNCLLAGLASGQIAEAICAAGKKASRSAANHEDAAVLATASRITSVSPRQNDNARDVEHSCAEAVVNSIVDAVILKEDDKQDGGSGVILSATPSLVEESQLEDVRSKLQDLLLRSCETGDLAQALQGVEKEIAREEARIDQAYDTTSAMARARLRKHERNERRKSDRPMQASTDSQTSALRAKGFLSAPAQVEGPFDATSAIARARERKHEKQRRRSHQPGKADDMKADDVEVEELQTLDDLKQKLHSRIADAFDSGRLEEVVATAFDKKPSIPTGKKSVDLEAVDDLRIRLHDRITNALDEGRLDVMMQESIGVKPRVSRTERGSLLMEAPAVISADQENIPPTNVEGSSPSSSPRASSRDHSGRRTKRGSLMMDPPEFVDSPKPPESPKPAPPKVEAAAVLDLEGSQRLYEEMSAHEEEIRLKARSILIKATLDDGLERALAQVEAENEEALLREKVRMEELEDIRGNFRDILIKCNDDGSLTEALEKTQEGHLRACRDHISSLLWVGAENGELADALRETQGYKENLAKTKEKAREALYAALGGDDDEANSETKERSKEKARDALLAALGDDTEAEEVEDIRYKMRKLLMTSHENGSLAAGLQQVKEDKVEQIRNNMAELLQASFDNGNLEVSLKQLKDDRLDDIRTNMATLLWSNCESGELDKKLEDMTKDRAKDKARDALLAALGDDIDEATKQKARDALMAALGDDDEEAPSGTPSKPTYVGTPSPPVKASSGMKTDMPAIDLAIEAMSQRDRRIGELMAMINETKQQIVERDESCQVIEGKLGAARMDLAHMDLDVEWHRRALDDAKERSLELEAGQRKLLGELDGHQQKLRHAKIEAEESCIMSARSELSTATGGATAASSLNGCFTPRNFITTTVLDPILLTTPSSPLPPTRG